MTDSPEEQKTAFRRRLRRVRTHEQQGHHSPIISMAEQLQVSEMCQSGGACKSYLVNVRQGIEIVLLNQIHFSHATLINGLIIVIYRKALAIVYVDFPTTPRRSHHRTAEQKEREREREENKPCPTRGGPDCSRPAGIQSSQWHSKNC